MFLWNDIVPCNHIIELNDKILCEPLRALLTVLDRK